MSLTQAPEMRTAAGLFAALFLLSGLSDVAAAPQTFNTALPVADGSFVFRQQFLYLDAGNDPGPADRKLNVAGGVSVLGYGMNSRLALFGALPYLDKQLRLSTPEGQRIRRDTRGVGDARLWARYTVIQDDAPGRTFRVAPFAGVEAPTGRDDDRDRFGRLPPPLQRGSGSWDPFFGIIASYQTLDYQLDALAGYEINTASNRFEFGDELRLDTSLQYRLWPRELGAGVPGFVYGIVELNFSDREKNRIAGDRDPNSGGRSLSIAPGLQYVTKRWIAEGIVQIPVAQDLNGTALEDDFTVRFGFRANF